MNIKFLGDAAPEYLHFWLLSGQQEAGLSLGLSAHVSVEEHIQLKPCKTLGLHCANMNLAITQFYFSKNNISCFYFSLRSLRKK